MPDSRGEPAKKDLLTKLLKGLEGQPQTGAEHFSLPAWISLQSCCVLSCPVLCSHGPLLMYLHCIHLPTH